MSELDFREQEWGTADGRRLPIKEMTLGHLVNVLNWVNDHSKSYSDRIRDTMRKEAEYRKLFLFAEGKPYPGLVDGVWKVIDPQTGTGSIIKPPDDYIEAVKDNPAYQRMSEAVKKIRKTRKSGEQS